MRSSFKFLIFSTIVLTASCAPVSKLPPADAEREEAERAKQYELVINEHLEKWRRFHKTAYPILKANADLCGEEVWKTYSFKFIDASYFTKKMEKHAISAGISKKPTVVSVPAGSGAHDVGVKEGDVVVAIGDWRLPDEGYRDEFQAKIEEHGSDDVISMTFLRKSEEIEILIPLEVTCGYSMVLQNDSMINAFADGKRIIFTSGIMNLLTNDNHLAAVIGHELAHNTMDHISKKQGNAALGSVVDILFAGLGVNTSGAFSNMAGGAYSQEFEAEADYVGLYYMYRAGYPIEDAPNVWRRMVLSNPSSIQDHHASSHPASPARYVALEDTIKEIKQKVAEGKPIVPDRKPE